MVRSFSTTVSLRHVASCSTIVNSISVKLSISFKLFAATIKNNSLDLTIRVPSHPLYLTFQYFGGLGFDFLVKSVYVSKSLIDKCHNVPIATNRSYAYFCDICMRYRTGSCLENRSRFQCSIGHRSRNKCKTALCMQQINFMETSNCLHCYRLPDNHLVGMR